MKMLTCFIPPSSGTAEICGFSILDNPLQVRAQIGYLPESAPSYDEMLVGEFLSLVAEIRGYGGKELRRRVSIVIEMTALGEVKEQLIETLSKGFRQRTSLAQALLHDPPVLILDDSTSSVDVETERLIHEAMAEVMKNRTTFVIAHRLSTVRDADLILILGDGEIVERGTHLELMALGGIYQDIYELQLRPQEEVMLDARIVSGNGGDS